MIDNYPNVRVIRPEQYSAKGFEIYELRYVTGSPESIEGSVTYEEVEN